MSLFLYVAPAFAFSSLNGCLSEPACATMLGVTGTSGVPAGVTTMALPQAARVAALRAAAAPGATTGLKVLFAGGVASLGPLALHALSPDDTSELSAFWSEPLDPSQPGNYAANGGVKIRAYSFNNAQWLEPNVLSVSGPYTEVFTYAWGSVTYTRLRYTEGAGSVSNVHVLSASCILYTFDAVDGMECCDSGGTRYIFDNTKVVYHEEDSWLSNTHR